MKKQILFAYPTLHRDDCKHLIAETFYLSNGIELSKTGSSLKGISLSIKEDRKPWIPQSHPLTIVYNPEPQSLTQLFKKAMQVIHEDAIPAIALHWYSKESLQSGISTPIKMNAVDTTPSTRLNFEKASIRGLLSIQVVLFLLEPSHKPNQDLKYLCNYKGAILGYPGEEWQILTDGSGSSFPIFFVSLGRDNALWSLKCEWDNCMEDKFDGEFVRIEINLDHPDCPDEIREFHIEHNDTTSANYSVNENQPTVGAFTKSIVRTAIGTLVLHLQQTEAENWQVIKETSTIADAVFKKGSVAHAVWHLYHNKHLNDQTPADLMRTAAKIKINV